MFDKKPVIGIGALYDEKKESWWMLPGYMQMLEAAGAIPLMMPLTLTPEVLEYFLTTCDGFIIPGGQDVSPEVYHEEKQEFCGVNIEIRDKMDAYILREAIRRDKPVLGICRGHQLMNAVLGGTLYQDLPAQFGETICHRMSQPYDAVAHEVELAAGTPLAKLLGVEKLGVNSRHHQAIRDLAPCLKPMAVAADGLVEAVYMPGKRFVWGLQWHPEHAWLVSEENRKIVAEFVKAAQPRWQKPTDDLTDGVIRLELRSTCDANPERDWLPAYYFDICLMDGTNVGYCDLRIGHNHKTYIGGNIGYGVHEAHRGHRYAARACRLLFRQAKKHDMTRLYISCVPENAASRRTIDLAGFRYLEDLAVPPDNEMYADGKRLVRVYAIDLEDVL